MSDSNGRAKEIFLKALNQTGDLKSFVEGACGGDEALQKRVEALLDAHRAAGEFLPPSNIDATIDSGGPTPDEMTRSQPAAEPKPSSQIGPYKLLEEIGEGGMGTVWVAQQSEPIKRKVAIKLIKAGMDSQQVLARFEAERQALAMMDHPNIARVVDAGMTEQGRPYFAMEYVKGVPLTEYCDQAKLSVKERLELFLPICNAVQHAHQKGIIHRDLKPSNILICLYDGKPVPKVIDFGLAKAMHQSLTDRTLHTGHGMMIGTPLYMSPEQAESNNLDIDTRTDIYSLGVILYELLTGSTPLEKAQLKEAVLLEVLRLIKEAEPPKPSMRLSGSESLPSVAAQRSIDPAQLTRRVTGDLDWVVMKALEKERGRRYETANGLSEDIRRHLSDEPVSASPPSAKYRMQKFVKRNKGQVIAASLVLLALAGGVIGTSYGMFRANRAAQAENLAKIDAEKGRIEAEKQKSRAEDREQQAIDAVKRFRDAVADNPELKNNPALEPLRKTLLTEPLTYFRKLREQLQADSDTGPEALMRLAEAARELGFLTAEIGDKQNAQRSVEESLEIYKRLVRQYPNKYDEGLGITHNNLGELQLATGQVEAAEASIKQAIAIYERLARENPAFPAYANREAGGHMNLGALQSQDGRNEAATESLRRALEISDRLAREHPSNTEYASSVGGIHVNLGKLHWQAGQSAAADDSYGRALEIFERLARDKPDVTEHVVGLATVLANFGLLQNQIGQSEEAEGSFGRSLEIFERLASENPTVTAYAVGLSTAHRNLAGILRETGRNEAARESYKAALAINRKLVADHPESPDYASHLGATIHNLAIIDMRTKRFAEARELLNEAISWQNKALSIVPDSAQFRLFMRNHLADLGNVCRSMNDAPGEAEAKRRFLELNAHSPDPRLAMLDGRLMEVARGEAPKDNAERFALIRRAFTKKLYAVATRMFIEAFENDPSVEENLEFQLRYNAAVCAALAAAGADPSQPSLDDQAKTIFRKQAYQWMAAELDAWSKFAKSANNEQRADIAGILNDWRQDKDLGIIRDDAAIQELPEAERNLLQGLWQGVDELHEKYHLYGLYSEESAKKLESQGKLDEEIAEIRKTIVLNPDDANGHFALSMFLSIRIDSAEMLAECGQVIGLYDKLIDDETSDARWLSNRAQAHAQLKNWDAAKADWRRAFELDPSQLQKAIDFLATKKQWRTAAEFGWQLIEVDPTLESWHCLRSIMFLADEQAAYIRFCNFVVEQPMDTPLAAGTAIKACLLRPGAVDIAKLPGNVLRNALKDGSTESWRTPYAWGALALLNYRSGNAEGALQDIEKAEQLNPGDFARVQHLPVLAMAQHELGNSDAALATLEKSSRLLARLNENYDMSSQIHTLTHSEILFREAEAKIRGKTDSVDEAATPPEDSTTTPAEDQSNTNSEQTESGEDL